MSEMTLTSEEKRCLQMWFRQAIAHVEMEETKARMQNWFADDKVRTSHHAPTPARRARRTAYSAHKELV